MTGFIFQNRFGNTPNPSSINRTIKSIVAKHNEVEVVKARREKREPVIIPNFSCHITRHTFCTRLCENETNIKVIQTVMGHAGIETTMDIYAEATDEKNTEAIENLSKKLDLV
jgi:integrase